MKKLAPSSVEKSSLFGWVPFRGWFNRPIERRKGSWKLRVRKKPTDRSKRHVMGRYWVWRSGALIGPVFLNHGQGRGNGINAQRYVDWVLPPHVVPFFENRWHFAFQQDNARPHSARMTPHFLQEKNITVLPSPSLSPDLNSIEHFWDEVERQLFHHFSPHWLQVEVVLLCTFLHVSLYIFELLSVNNSLNMNRRVRNCCENFAILKNSSNHLQFSKIWNQIKIDLNVWSYSTCPLLQNPTCPTE